MTEPDPVAVLAAQLDELRGQLARTQGDVGTVRARMEEFSGQDMVMLRAIKQLAEKVDDAVSKRQAEDPQAPYWLGLSREEHAARMAQLRSWVDQVARVQYGEYFAKLTACWPDHPVAVIELSDLMTEWIRIYGDPQNRPLQDALLWHDKWLPGVLARLGAVLAKCGFGSCQVARSMPYERAPPNRS